MAYRGPEVAFQVPAMITGVRAGILGDGAPPLELWDAAILNYLGENHYAFLSSVYNQIMMINYLDY